MSHTARRQESQRKHGKTPPANDAVLRLLEFIQSEQVEPPQPVAPVDPNAWAFKNGLEST